MTASKETRSTLIFERNTYPAGVTRAVVNLRSIERLTVQWSAFDTNVGVTAQIRFFIATADENVITDGADDPLSDKDPAVNRLWAPLTDSTGTDVTFASEPAGTPDSEALNLPTPEMHSLCGTALLVQLTVAGGDLTEFLMSARLSTGAAGVPLGTFSLDVSRALAYGVRQRSTVWMTISRTSARLISRVSS